MLYSEFLKGQKINLNFEKQKNILRQKAKNKLNTNKKNEDKRIKELSEFLNGLFYPKAEEGKKEAKLINEKLASLYELEFNRSLENFSLGDERYMLKGASDIDHSARILREQYETFSHKEKIYIKTIQTRLKKCEELLNKIDSLDMAIEAKDKIKSDLTELQKNLWAFAANYFDKESEVKGYVRLSEDKGSIEALKIIDEQYKALSEWGITPKDYGDLFEMALGLASYQNLESMEDETVKSLLEPIITGSQRVSGDVAFEMKDFIQNITFEKGNKVMVSKTKGAGSSRQQKTDIEFVLPNKTNEKFKISAKNWLSSGDFGETNLWYVIQRTLTAAQAEGYLKAMGKPNTESNQLKQAHDLAKLAIFLDVVMGYSQAQGWADTLVLNIRSQKRVIVESVYNLLNSLDSEKSKVSVVYPESEIEKISRKEAETQNGTDRNLFKANLVRKYIDIKVSARYNLFKS